MNYCSVLVRSTFFLREGLSVVHSTIIEVPERKIVGARSFLLFMEVFVWGGNPWSALHRTASCIHTWYLEPGSRQLRQQVFVSLTTVPSLQLPRRVLYLYDTIPRSVGRHDHVLPKPRLSFKDVNVLKPKQTRSLLVPVMVYSTAVGKLLGAGRCLDRRKHENVDAG